jgi:DNA-binding beta-propeller fold protein YncE
MSFRRDGERLWATSYNGPAGGPDYATDVGVSPDGQTVFVTGGSHGPTDADVATLAYSASGQQLWAKRYDSGEADNASTVAVSPDGTQLFVATGHDTISTLAYTSSGTKSWVRNESWSGEGAAPRDVAVTADGTAVLVTGNVRDVYWQAAVIAYSTT